MRQTRLKLGIIGLGIISDAHVQGAAEMADIVDIAAMCDLDIAKVTRVAAPYGAQVYTDYRKVVDEAGVDVVDIILPHNLHFEVASYALERGKHVLIEKPLALNSREGLRLVEMARAAGVKFSVAENTRFVTAYLEAEKLLRDGKLGEIYLIRTLIAGSELDRLAKPHPWKAKKEGSGGGVIMDAGPHTFYLLKWLFGEIAWVQAFESRVVSASGVEDNAIVIGKMAGGADFTAQFSFTALIPWTERLEIYGSKAALLIDQISNPPAILYRGTHDFQGTPLSAVRYNPVNWKYQSIVDEVKDFLRVVWTDGTPAVDPWDAYYGLCIIEQAYASLQRG